jgi:hypothetical protein
MLAIHWIAVAVASVLTIAVVTISGVALAAHYLTHVFSLLLSEENPAAGPRSVHQK